MTKYVITLESEDGPLLVSPMGGVIIYHSYDEAKWAAMKAPPGQTRWIHHTLPMAVYTGKADVAMIPANQETISDSLAS